MYSTWMVVGSDNFQTSESFCDNEWENGFEKKSFDKICYLHIICQCDKQSEGPIYTRFANVNFSHRRGIDTFLEKNSVKMIFVSPQGANHFLLWKTTFRNITKTRLYNFDPLKPHFYIIKLGFTEVYIIFSYFAKKYRLWVLVRTASPRRF